MFISFPKLITRRLILRELTIDDVDEFHELANFPEQELSRDQVIDKINSVRRDFETGNGISWAIMLNDDLIGTCGYYRGFENKTGEIGFVLKEKYRRKGYMTEALETILLFGFEQLNLNRIAAFTLATNEPTQHLLQKSGFQLSNEKHEKYLIFELFNA